MPPRYFADSVVTRIKDGKEISDTVWHKVANVRLVNQLGDTVSLDSLRGKVILIDFFFTHCASICPILTHNMRHLQDALKSSDKAKLAEWHRYKFCAISVIDG